MLFRSSLRNDAAAIDLELGRATDALRHFRAVTALQPRSAPAWYNEGVALEAAGQADAAADRYRRAIALDPGHSAAHNNLATILAAQGHIDEAVAEYRRAVEADRANAEAHNNLGGFLLTFSLGEAVEHLEAALALRPDYPEAHFNLARAFTVEEIGRAHV